MRAGASDAKIRAVAAPAGSDLFTDAERAALELADAMTLTGRRVTDELFARLRTYFTEAQVVELAAAVALENFRSRLNVALGVEAQGFCALPDPEGSPPRTGPAAQKGDDGRRGR